MTTRRVVTGINADGKSYFTFDGATPGVVDVGVGVNEEIWVDDPISAGATDTNDPLAGGKFSLEPPRNGSVVRVFTFQPDNEVGEFTPEVVADIASRFYTGDAMEPDNPGMHTTKTIDYGIVLSGEIDLELDEGQVHLTPGDVVVQRGTRHAWRNLGSQPCTMAFILISSPNYQ